MAETSGDTKPTGFDDPSLSWGDDPAPDAGSPPASDPQTPDTATAPSPESAIATSAPEPTPGEAPLPNGPIPLDRHKAILEGERKKYTDLDGKWQRVAWADTLVNAGKTPQQIQEALNLYDSFSGDPASVLERLYAGLSQHPQFAPQVKSWAGRVLAGGRMPIETSNPQADPEPGPDFQNEQGVPFFSGPQLSKWQAWRERQLQATFEGRIAPLEQARQQAEQAAATERLKAQVSDQVTQQLQEMRQKPHFVEHEAAIKAYLAERHYNASLESAYIHVLTTKVLPGLSASERAKTVTELKTQAAASSAKPARAASATPMRPKDFNDPGLRWD